MARLLPEWVVEVEPGTPGWFGVPCMRDEDARTRWVDAIAAQLAADWGAGWQEAFDAPVREAAREVLSLRDEAPALAIFLVWPIVAPLPVICHVSVVASSSLPVWAELDAVVHGLEAEGLGPGIQCTVRRSVDDGERVSMHLVFDDGSTTLILSIDETLPTLLVRALPAFLRLPSTVSMQTVDGVPFAPRPIPGLLEAEPWAVDAPGTPGV